MDPAMRQFLITTGKQALEATARDDDGFIPTLVVERDDGQFEVMVLIGSHPFVMMQAILPTLREMQPTAMGLTTDSYMGTGEVMDLVSRRAEYNGSLQAMFEAGEPGVTECLVIHIARKGETEVIELPYVRSDEGIEWKPFEHPDREHTGRLIDVLQAVWV